MSLDEGKVSYFDATGAQQEITISLADYRAAEEHQISLAAYFNAKYPTNEEQYGSTFSQFARSCGLFMSEDPQFGLRAPTIKAVLEGKTLIAGAAVMRPDGSQSNTPAGRLLFPSVLTEVLEANLREDKDSYIAAFMQFVAFTTVVDSQKYEQVIIDYKRPRAARSQPIGQLAEPNRVLSITTSDRSKKLPVYSLGMEFSDQAAAAATLDLVGLAIREQASEERAYAAMRDLKNLVNGSNDTGDTALTSSPITTFDSSISAANTITQKAWVKFLRSKWMKRNINVVFCSLDDYLIIEGRSGRPTADNNRGTDERLNTVPQLVLPGIPGNVWVFPLEDTSILGAGTLLGMDSRKGMRRVMYVAANYSAVESFVLRRSTVMRMDWSERIERLGYDEAFEKVTLTTS